MNAEESVAAHAKWLVARIHANKQAGSDFSWFWESIVSQFTVAVLRDAARILKIERPAKTRAALREQFAAAWVS